MTSAQPGPYAGIPRLAETDHADVPARSSSGCSRAGRSSRGVSPDEARLLARLDGTLPPEDLPVVAGASGVSGRRWRVLLDLVVRLGLLEPLPASRAVVRVARRVRAPGVVGRRAPGAAGGRAETLVHVVGPARSPPTSRACWPTTPPSRSCTSTTRGRPQVEPRFIGAPRPRRTRGRRARGRHRARPAARGHLARAGRAPPAGGDLGRARRRRSVRRRLERLPVSLVPRPAPQRPRRGLAHRHGAGRHRPAARWRPPDGDRRGPRTGRTRPRAPSSPGSPELVAGTVAALVARSRPATGRHPGWPSR